MDINSNNEGREIYKIKAEIHNKIRKFILIELAIMIIFDILCIIFSLVGNNVSIIFPVLFGTIITVVNFQYKKIIYRKVRQLPLNSRGKQRRKITKSLVTIPGIACLCLCIVTMILCSAVSTNHDDEYTASIFDILFKKDSEEEEEEYKWPDYYSDKEYNLGEVEKITIDGIEYSYGYQGDLLVQFALNEWHDYWPDQPMEDFKQIKKNAAIQGGERYWDFAESQGHYLERPWHWCAAFITYCIDRTGLAEKGELFEGMLKKEDVARTHNNILGAPGWRNWLKNVKGLQEISVFTDYKPMPGDIMVCLKENSAGHVGIIEKTENNIIWSIEGNVSGEGRGNVSAGNSVVKRMKYKINEDGSAYDNGNRRIVVFHPNYRIIATNGQFDIENYSKNSDGYYTPSEVEKIVFDYAMTELGYNQAAACGVIGNLNIESGFKYDQLEVATGGIAYTSKSTSSQSYRTAGTFGNGNYRKVPNIETTLMLVKNLYYQSGNGKWTNYGMGYGLVQWSSFGGTTRRVQLLNYIKDRGVTDRKDSLIAQLEFIKKEVTENFPDMNRTLQNIPNTVEGAKEAAGIWEDTYERGWGRQKRIDAAEVYWEYYKDRKPATVNYNSGNSNETIDNKSGINIQSVTIIGDSNTVRMVNNGTAIENANKVLAITGVGVGSFKSRKIDNGATYLCKNRTLTDAINNLTKEDLEHVTIMLGTNDFYYGASEFKSNYTELLDKIKNKNPDAHVQICTIPPVNEDKSSSIKNSQVDNINQYITELVSEYTGLQLKLLDVHSQLDSIKDMSNVNEDGYHMNKDGCKKAAEFICNNCY